MKKIIYTAHDGGVRVYTPSREIFRIMASGGYWSDRPRGFLQKQIERQISDGIDPDHARRFANATEYGGCTTAEVYDILKDRDCGRHGRLHELIDPLELPDRWFRNAWRRSGNGGPPSVNLELAKPIQWSRLWDAVEEENKKRRAAFNELKEIIIDKARIKSAIKHARDDEELRRIWPEELRI